MKTKILIASIASLFVLGAIGTAARYIEELRIGGGYGSTPDGGLDIEKNGDVRTNGSITADGGILLPDNKAVQTGTTAPILWRYNATTGRAEWTDGLNVLMSLTDAGTTGNLGVTGNVQASGSLNASGNATVGGDVAVNGGDIASTASTLNIAPAANGTVTMLGNMMVYNDATVVSDLTSTVPNNAMETATAWTSITWTGWAPVSQGQTTARAHAGSASWRFTTSGNSQGIINGAMSQWCYPGERYVVTYWASGDGVNAMRVMPHNGPGAWSIYGPVVAPPNGTWQQYSFAFTVTHPTPSIFDLVFVSASSASATFYVDDVTLAKRDGNGYIANNLHVGTDLCFGGRILGPNTLQISPFNAWAGDSSRIRLFGQGLVDATGDTTLEICPANSNTPTITMNGKTGNVATTGDLTVNGGDITSTAQTLTLSPGAGGNVAVNGDFGVAAGKTITGAFKASTGAAGVTAIITIPTSNPDGSDGSLLVMNGIIIGYTNPY